MSFKDLILGATENRQPVPVAVPEWPEVGTVYLLPMSGDDLDRYDQLKSQKMYPLEDEGEADWRGVRAITVSMHVCDADGNREQWTEAEVNGLGRKSAIVLDRLYQKCCKISALRPSDVEDAEKNLSGGPTENSGSS